MSLAAYKRKNTDLCGNFVQKSRFTLFFTQKNARTWRASFWVTLWFD
jgi:hypothetical protein